MRILSTLAAFAAFAGGSLAQTPAVPFPAVTPLPKAIPPVGAMVQAPVAAPTDPPVPMPKPEPKAKVTPDKPHKIFVGEWEMMQFLRPVEFLVVLPSESPNPNEKVHVRQVPIPKGKIEFRDDLTFTWITAQNDKMSGTYFVHEQKIVLTRSTPLGEKFTYNLIHLDIIDGKVIRPIRGNCYEEWTRIPPKKKD